MKNDKRLIEDYLPIQAISKEASREKSVRKGHISTLHLWWARRPLVACRAAVYGALVPASQFVPENGPDNKKQSLGRANAAKFVTELCKYPGNPRFIAEAQKHILEAHAERLTAELKEAKTGGAACPTWVEEFKFKGEKVTREDIEAGRAPRPKVLDMFAGGGAIPLEALRLGCEAYALDLNPVAHIIELCTLVYPQKYGKPDPNAKGMTGPEQAGGLSSTWGGLAEEVKYWGNWILEKVRKEIGDLYPLIPDPKASPEEIGAHPQKVMKFAKDSQGRLTTPRGYLTPVAYLWTRTVRCKNPSCGATVPLARQTWLCKKKAGKKSPGRYVALKMVAGSTDGSPVEKSMDDKTGRRPVPQEKKVQFEVVEATTEAGLGFDPSVGSKGGNATCPFCGTVADSEYVMSEGKAHRRGEQLMCIVATRQTLPGKIYLSDNEGAKSEGQLDVRIEKMCSRSALSVPTEPINEKRPSPNARGLSPVTRHGFSTFGDLFTKRQLLCLLTFVEKIGNIDIEADEEKTKALKTCLSLVLDRVADYCSNFCQWRNNLQTVGHTFARHALAMLWDFAEGSPLFGASGTWDGMLNQTCGTIDTLAQNFSRPADSRRGSAFSLPWPDASIDAVITDPPYYDNIPYADVSDFFYVWLKRSTGRDHGEHFSTLLTPKKSEATALASRHAGDFRKATEEYEKMMLGSLREASRVLKQQGVLAIVYAHKTTLGWATLVDAVRKGGFTVHEAWPLNTEMKARVIAQETAALASSIFLVVRKREGAETGSYEEVVQPELGQIVRERVDTLWKMGITGADLVIAAVGAGLRAFTRFARVEYANGEEVPAEKFLAEVEGVVLETLLEKIFVGQAASLSSTGQRPVPLGNVDGPSRFYVLWRYTYKAAEMDAGEAIVFTYGQNVELDGQKGLTGHRPVPLLEKKKGKYRLLDFTERGENEKLGLPVGQAAGLTPAPLIDALHRILWLVENQPRKLNRFLDEAQPDRERLRLVAQALAGPGLSGKSEEESGRLVGTTASEQSALKKLLANWRALIEQRLAAREGELFR